MQAWRPQLLRIARTLYDAPGKEILLHCRQWHPQRVIRRSARTRATVKLTDLPQGPLAAFSLPNVEDDSAPAFPPVIQQHLNHVRQFKDCVVLTRVGNFYELYGDQAEQYGPLLNLKVAQRRTALGPIAMAGFQITQLDRYLKMLVQNLNQQVAISEEIRNSAAEQAKKNGLLYTRRVSRVITAGTLIDEHFMDPYENNFLLAIHMDHHIHTLEPSTTPAITSAPSTSKSEVGLAWVDLSSGDFFTQTTDQASLASVLARIGAREIVLNDQLEHLDQKQRKSLLGEVSGAVAFHPFDAVDSSLEKWSSLLEKPIQKSDSELFTPNEVRAGSLLLDYVKGKLIDLKISLQHPVRRTEHEYMSIDKNTLRGLEIRKTLREGFFQGSLLHAIRRTVTKSGARLLSQRLLSPSMSLIEVNQRLDLVQEFLLSASLREDIIVSLRRTCDSLRLLQKFSVGRGDADDLLALAKTMQVSRRIFTMLEKHSKKLRRGIAGPEDFSSDSSKALAVLLARFNLKESSRLATRITKAIDEDGLSQKHLVEEAEVTAVSELANQILAEQEDTEAEDVVVKSRPPTANRKEVEDGHGEIWIMRRSASAMLTRAHSELDTVMQEKHALAARLRAELGANSLTLKWTPQLGHFCHVKGKDARTIPDGARSISSSKTTRTFYLPDWTILGHRLEDAKSLIRTEEQRVFEDLRNDLLKCMTKLRRNAAVLDELDVASSSATLATERSLTRPILHDGTTHKVIAGRHPMVDAGLQENGKLFTANDCAVGGNEKILMITGPNMAGKSTYLRQNALISILAQTGCFVPAAYAEIGLVDKLFSRVGSADDLYNNQSTFMIEMLEAAEILHQATERSFVIMDEIGRGTTPEDGLAVSYACLHHLHHVNRSRTLFATHFHALVDMTAGFDRLACYCTDVAENAEDGSWVYVHRLRRGVNRQSHALKVARLAGLPEEAIEVAGKVLCNLKESRQT